MDINSLTVGEVARIEQLASAPIGALADDNKPKGLLMAAFAFVVKYRTNPEFTWDEALNLSLTDVNALLGLDADSDPKAQN